MAMKNKQDRNHKPKIDLASESSSGKEEYESSGGKKLRGIVFVGILVLCVAVAFAFFIEDNSRRATQISVKSLKDATNQCTQRIDKILERAQSEIILTADLYEEMLTKPKVEPSDLKTLTDKSPFDDIEYVDVNGVEINSDGRKLDVSDRDYFLDGLNGNSGICPDFKSDINMENLVVFYSPLYYDKEIIGVLLGIYTEGQMEEVLYSSFFDESSRTFLCTRDGTVIASGTPGHISDSIFEATNFNTELAPEVQDELREALRTGSEYEFQYEGTSGTGNAYVTTLQQNDWMLVQTFPSQVTSQIISDANRAGVTLLVELIAIFLICIAVVEITGAVQKKRLIKENEEKGYVVNGIMQLFDVFILVDLEKGTYRYLVDTQPWHNAVESEGNYSDLVKFVADKTSDPEESEHLSRMLSTDMLLQSLDMDTPHLRYEYCFQDGGKLLWDSLNIICIKRVNNMPSQILITRQDVTKAKVRELESYEALKSAYAALENANQAKTRFLNNMSHDIRTPMNAIIGFTALASTHIDKPKLVEDYLRKIMISGNHLLSLINDVLDMSRIESGKVKIEEKDCNLPDIMHDLKNIMQTDIHSKRLEFLIDTVDVVDENVICDKLRLNQILLNCLSNAMKFTEPGGTVSVRIIQKTGAPAGYADFVFKVRDTGIGMSKEFMEHIFEPFERERSSTVSGTQGTGLGMAITKNIVDMMNGTITVESEEGKGSEFTIALRFKLSGEPHIVEEVPQLKGLRALVADDDFNTCTSVAKMLTTIGLRADWTTSGREAVLRAEFAVENKDEYRVYIIDWLMPDMNGIECVRRIRKAIGDDVPIIILTAYDWADIETEAIEAGVTAFCSKPLFLSELRETLLKASGCVKAETPKQEEETFSFEGKRVLLAEDVELNREIAEEALREVGIEVDSVQNGMEAVEKITQASEDRYDLILMDIQMPVMNGYDACKLIREMDNTKKSHIPIIAMTADAFEEDRRLAFESGMDGHIAKPMQLEVLYREIKKHIK
jgi:signal transduction histidine kinase/DNA-binding response OmpR family regulator